MQQSNPKRLLFSIFGQNVSFTSSTPAANALSKLAKKDRQTGEQIASETNSQFGSDLSANVTQYIDIPPVGCYDYFSRCRQSPLSLLQSRLRHAHDQNDEAT